MQMRNFAVFARMMLGATLAFALLAWMSALFLFYFVVAIVVKGVALLIQAVRRPKS